MPKITGMTSSTGGLSAAPANPKGYGYNSLYGGSIKASASTNAVNAALFCSTRTLALIWKNCKREAYAAQFDAGQTTNHQCSGDRSGSGPISLHIIPTQRYPWILSSLAALHSPAMSSSSSPGVTQRASATASTVDTRGSIFPPSNWAMRVCCTCIRLARSIRSSFLCSRIFWTLCPKSLDSSFLSFSVSISESGYILDGKNIYRIPIAIMSLFLYTSELATGLVPEMRKHND